DPRLGREPPRGRRGVVQLLRVAGDRDAERRLERRVGTPVLAAAGQAVVAVEGDRPREQGQEREPGAELEAEAAQAAAALRADRPTQASSRRCRYLSGTGSADPGGSMRGVWLHVAAVGLTVTVAGGLWMLPKHVLAPDPLPRALPGAPTIAAH